MHMSAVDSPLSPSQRGGISAAVLGAWAPGLLSQPLTSIPALLPLLTPSRGRPKGSPPPRWVLPHQPFPGLILLLESGTKISATHTEDTETWLEYVRREWELLQQFGTMWESSFSRKYVLSAALLLTSLPWWPGLRAALQGAGKPEALGRTPRPIDGARNLLCRVCPKSL